MFIARGKSKITTAGFTLVELLVTISIFAILTGVVLFSQARFNSTILLTNLAYDTAFTVRQAQTYGINIKNFSTTTIEGGNIKIGSNFVPYGVHFDMTQPKSFILFADLSYVDNLTYEGVFNRTLSECVDSEGCVSRYNITRGNFIKEICLDIDKITSCDYKSADIVFVRPNPNAVITVKPNNGGKEITEGFSAVRIRLGSPVDKNLREVVVQPNGLIYVSKNVEDYNAKN